MLGKVKTVFRRLNTKPEDGTADAGQADETSVSADGGTVAESATGGAETAPQPHLYECPSCDRVYVAIDKRTCSTCDIDVDRID